MLPKDNIGYLIGRLSHSLQQPYSKILDAYNITVKQFAILRLLKIYEGLSVTEMLPHLYSDTSTLNEIVDKLESKNLIQRRVHPEDRRINQVFLTNDAHMKIDEILPKIALLQNECFGVLSLEEQNQLVSLLNKLFNHVLNLKKT